MFEFDDRRIADGGKPEKMGNCVRGGQGCDSERLGYRGAAVDLSAAAIGGGGRLPAETFGPPAFC